MATAFFTPRFFDFLRELRENNDREWFTANKDRYEADVREPALAFVRAMGPRLAAISPHIVADDSKSGGSMFRIYRDTRFSKDKTPYKDHVGIAFSHSAGKKIVAPAFYLHLAADEVWAGVGMWQPPNLTLNAVRSTIDRDQDRWRQVITDERFTAAWTREGEQLKRPPHGYDKAHPFADDLRYKSHTATSPLSVRDVYEAGFPDVLAARFAAASDYVRFLSEAVGVAF